MTIRTRGTDKEDVPLWYTGYCNGVLVTPSVQVGTMHILRNYEIIADEDPQRTRFGNVMHRKRSCNFQVGVCSFTNGGICDGVHLTEHRYNSDYAFVKNVIGDASIDWNQLNQEAYETMKPSMESGFSLSNFLAELGDIRSMFKLWQKGKALYKNIASGYLNYQFGWKLFIQDVQSIYDRLCSFNATLESFKANQGRPMTRHFKKVLLKGETETNEYFQTGTVENGNTWERDLVFHATMRYSYTVPQLDQEYSRLKALSDFYGLKFNASVLWEALPYSFVVDWFLGVGEYLRSREPDYLESNVKILDFCCSIKQMTKQWFWYRENDSGDTHQLGGYEESLYVRRRMLPNATTLYGPRLAHRYGSKQVLLSAALLAS